MAKYGTQEWCDLYKEELNNSKAYEKAAKTWEGDFIFITDKGGPMKEPLYEYVDLYHGKCRKAEMITDPSKYNPEFIISAPYHIWKRICLKQLDSTQALIVCLSFGNKIADGNPEDVMNQQEVVEAYLGTEML